MEAFEVAWNRVRDDYIAGYCVSERGLQAALYRHLTEVNADWRVVVEPKWSVSGRNMTPDLVIVTEHQIRHIFELKFVPHHYAQWKPDIAKLQTYVAPTNSSYSVSLIPQSGKWAEPLPISQQCALHFVAIANYDAEAVNPPLIIDELGRYGENHHPVTLWYGRVRGKDDDPVDWGIRTCT